MENIISNCKGERENNHRFNSNLMRAAILLFIGLYGTFAFYNSRLKAEIALHSQRNLGFLLFAIAHLTVTICFFYYLYDDMKLYLSLVFIPPYVQPLTVTDLIWLVAVTDFILKLITIILKILITIIPHYLFEAKRRVASMFQGGVWDETLTVVSDYQGYRIMSYRLNGFGEIKAGLGKIFPKTAGRPGRPTPTRGRFEPTQRIQIPQ